MSAGLPLVANDRRPVCKGCDSVMHIRVSKQESWRHRPYWRCGVSTGNGGFCSGYRWVDSDATNIRHVNSSVNVPEHTPSRDDYPSCLYCGSRMQQFLSYSSANPQRPYWICTAENGKPFCSGFSWADSLFPEQLSIPPRIVVSDRHELKSHWSTEEDTEDFWTDVLINEWENQSYDSEELFPDEHANLDPDHFI